MRVSVNHGARVVQIWLGSGETIDDVPLFCAAKGIDSRYKKVLLRSGRGSLVNSTSMLLKNNTKT